MNTDELIAGARRSSDALRKAPFKIDRESFADGIDALADALEAATRVPVQGEPNDDREALKKIIDRVDDGDWGNIFPEERDEIADAILAAGFSRATVPDAATKARVKKIILESLVFTNENSDPWAQLLSENILAALDGAPEPEWQESRGILHSNGLLEVGSTLPAGRLVKVRRRKAGPWEVCNE